LKEPKSWRERRVHPDAFGSGFFRTIFPETTKAYDARQEDLKGLDSLFNKINKAENSTDLKAVRTTLRMEKYTGDFIDRLNEQEELKSTISTNLSAKQKTLTKLTKELAKLPMTPISLQQAPGATSEQEQHVEAQSPKPSY
jgi:hypothetical protein